MVKAAYCAKVILTDKNFSNNVETELVINLQRLQSHNLKREFLFGKHFGENQFDKEKIQLLEDNNNLKKDIDSLNSRSKQLEKELIKKENN